MKKLPILVRKHGRYWVVFCPVSARPYRFLVFENAIRDANRCWHGHGVPYE